MKRVMVVDDAAFMRLTISKMLQRNGYEIVAEAVNGEDGIIKYKEFEPDIVTMDITMPDMTGIEALKAICQYDPRAKVVMVSAMGQEKMVREAMMSGAKSFIIKPYKEEHIIQVISKVLEMA
jgi:two-component system, chemotaxis family, chemotaxis protein CheY